MKLGHLTKKATFKGLWTFTSKIYPEGNSKIIKGLSRCCFSSGLKGRKSNIWKTLAVSSPKVLISEFTKEWLTPKFKHCSTFFHFAKNSIRFILVKNNKWFLKREILRIHKKFKIKGQRVDNLVLWTDIGENVQKWTRVFSTRHWVILVARTRRKKEKKKACPLLDVFACGQVSSPRLYRLILSWYQWYGANR